MYSIIQNSQAMVAREQQSVVAHSRSTPTREVMQQKGLDTYIHIIVATEQPFTRVSPMRTC